MEADAALNEGSSEEPQSSDDDSSGSESREASPGPSCVRAPKDAVHPGAPGEARGRRRQLAPLEVRFSQMKMRHLFGDGRRIAEAMQRIRVVRCSETEAAEHGAVWKIETPFPTIEVVRWHCKLRDSRTGRPKLDPITGERLYDRDENWFTLDNRRLYCLQEAALRVWPDRCVADVCEIFAGLRTSIHELRKFRTLDLGRSIMVGSRAEKVPFMRWSWRVKAGIEEPGEAREAGRGDSRSAPPAMSVLEYLTSLKQDNHARIEISKKISWVVRHGATTVKLRMDSDGWISVNELLRLDVFDHVGAAKFFQVVTESNKQKKRYDLKETGDGWLIRASGRHAMHTAAAASGREQRILDTQVPRGRTDGARDAAPGRDRPGKDRWKGKGANGFSSMYVENGADECPLGTDAGPSKGAGKGGTKLFNAGSRDRGAKGKGGTKGVEPRPPEPRPAPGTEEARDRPQPSRAAQGDHAGSAKGSSSSRRAEGLPGDSAATSSGSHWRQRGQAQPQAQTMHQLQALHQLQVQARRTEYEMGVRHQLHDMFEAEALMHSQAAPWEPPRTMLSGPRRCSGTDRNPDEPTPSPYDGGLYVSAAASAGGDPPIWGARTGWPQPVEHRDPDADQRRVHRQVFGAPAADAWLAEDGVFSL